MKKGFLVAWILFAGINAFSQKKDIQVESDKALNKDFGKFKTFAFASMIDSNLEAGLYFLNDLVFKSQLREAVQEELMGLGYRMDKKNPDLVVNFRVFEEPTTLKGFEGYGSSYWGNQKYRHISDQTTYDVKAGTLLVSLLDKKDAQVVWQGFASGLIDNDKFIKDKATIRQAVSLIMDDYGVRVNNYSTK
ncbi:MAG TPA: DUF4136 domain-containing protein [Chitinophagaceae bacterium]